MTGEMERVQHLLICGVCDEGPQVRSKADVHHCPVCGSLMRSLPVTWDDGEIGPDTENLIGAFDSHD